MPKCPNCGHENEGAPKFCGECGSKLPQVAEGGVQAGGVTDTVIGGRSQIDASQTSAPASIGGINVSFGAGPGAPDQGRSPTLEFCAACGKPMPVPERRCPECREFACEEHYVADEFMCLRCLRLREKGQAPAAAPEPVAAPAGRTEPSSELATEITEQGIELVLVPAGPFMMGSENGGDDEKPVHEVHLDACYIGKHPVTNAQYGDFLEATGHDEPEGCGSEFSGPDRPVVGVSWHDAVAFCRWLSKQTGEDWRLPTEAEWEKAARGTDGREYPWGDQQPSSRYCSFDEQVGHTSDVGSYPAGVSPYGCHDMAGNVWEWCADRYGEDYYRKSPDRNPTGPSSGGSRVLRGGSWGDGPNCCRSAYRDVLVPAYAFGGGGFRVARS